MGDEKKTDVYAIGAQRASSVIKYSGTFDILELLGGIKGWYAKRYYELTEKEHSEAVKSSGKELVIEYEGVKKVTEYVTFKAVVKIVIYRLIDVLVETPQGKEKRQQAELDIGVKSWLSKNYKDTFKKSSKTQEFFRQVYERFIGKNHLDDLKTKLTNETLMLMDEIKTTLQVPKK
ncbi:hypothetical protein J4208_00255 [Candidatus Woesearchaeota archaeon]|nr:hypothetical protein [Candidatus Woesearchaeota archaeon]